MYFLEIIPWRFIWYCIILMDSIFPSPFIKNVNVIFFSYFDTVVDFYISRWTTFLSSNKRRPLGFTSVRVSRGCLRWYFAIICTHECWEDVSFWSTLALDNAKKKEERVEQNGTDSRRLFLFLYALPNMYVWYGALAGWEDGREKKKYYPVVVVSTTVARFQKWRRITS